ncbi:MAG: hypothetical protein ACI8TL_001459, partial [Natronomonas sp.]
MVQTDACAVHLAVEFVERAHRIAKRAHLVRTAGREGAEVEGDSASCLDHISSVCEDLVYVHGWLGKVSQGSPAAEATCVDGSTRMLGRERFRRLQTTSNIWKQRFRS